MSPVRFFPMIRVPSTAHGAAKHRLSLRLGVALAVLAGFGVAEDVQAAQIRSAPHKDYGRVVFDWNGTVGYSASVEKGKVIITFDQPVQDDPAKVARSLGEYVSGARLSPDRKTVTFDLKGDFAPKAFTSGKSVVLDLRKSREDADAPAEKVADAKPAETKAAPDAKGQDSKPAEAKAADSKAADPKVADPKATKPAGNTLPVTVAEQQGGTRLTFEWPKDTKYRVELLPDRSRFTFQRPAVVDVAAVRSHLPDSMQGFTATTTPKTLVVDIPLPPQGKMRHSATGNRVQVDVTAPNGQATPKEHPVAPPAAPPAAETPVASAPAAAPQAAAPAPASAVTPPAAVAAAPATKPPATGEAPAISPAAAALEQLMRDKLGMNRPGPGNPVQPVPDQQADGSEPLASPPLQPVPQANDSRVASLSFPWNEPTGAAVFWRGGWLWAVFDRPSEVDVGLLKRLGGGLVLHVEQVPSKTATVVRMLIEPGFNPSVRREGQLWVVDLMNQAPRPARPLPVEAQSKSAVGPRLLVQVTDPGRAMVLEDPEVGDRFIAVPVIPTGSGIFPTFRYPDLDLPVTVQGILVEPHTDGIVVNSSRSGVEMTQPGTGLTFSPDLTQMRTLAAVGTKTNLHRVLDIDTWMHGPESDFLKNRQLLQIAVANAPGGRRTNARLDLARFFFAHGYEAEALGVLRTMLTDQPEIEQTAAFRALRGVSNYAMGRYGEAVDDLSHSSLSGVEEAAFWRGAALAEQGAPALQALTMREYGSLLGSYPRRVKVPLALTAATATVAAGDDLGTNTFLTAAKVPDNTAHELAAIGYLSGKQEELRGNFDQALNTYDTVAETTDRYYRAMAIYDALMLRNRLEELSLDKLVAGLESLRFAWRGGDFEFKLLMQLGDLYTQKQDFGEALRVWQQAASYFEDRKEAVIAANRMRETFEKLFFDGAADALPPIRAIALYEEFRELTPAGPKGDEMIRRLADRLVGVDLLPQAAALLDRQIEFRLSGQDKVKVGTRLGLVYLLNREPQKAVESLLKTSNPDTTPQPLERQRQRLMARALADMGRSPDAIDLLEVDDSREADLLRAEIYWKDRNWPKVAEVFSRLLPEPAADLTLTDNQARMLLDWATALTLGQNERGVFELRRRYIGAMEKTPFANAFDLITTTPEGGLIDYRTIANRIKQAENFQSFLSSYQERLRNQGLSGIN
ncbi:tetratricopeptide repeat protein [Novispirillum itersonii subsp. nipponicum]